MARTEEVINTSQTQFLADRSTVEFLEQPEELDTEEEINRFLTEEDEENAKDQPLTGLTH